MPEAGAHMGDAPRSIPSVDVVPVLGHAAPATFTVDEQVPVSWSVMDATGETHAHADDGDGFVCGRGILRVAN